MATFTDVTLEEVRALANAYAFAMPMELASVPEGSVNSNFRVALADRTLLFLRVYEEQGHAGARMEAALLTHLAARGVPTPPPIASRDGEPIGTLGTKPAAFFPWRVGAMRCQASVTTDAVRAVGAALARVHLAGQACAAGAGRFNVADLRARLERIAGASAPELACQAEPLRHALDACALARTPLPSGMIHGDLFRDNVLWDGDRISALLDFESASIGPFVFDLAVCLLSWCTGDRFDCTLARAMIDGYRQVRELAAEERFGLYEEARFASLRFTITRITDYAMRVTPGQRVVKDWRRFAARYAELTAVGSTDFARTFAL